MELVNRLRKNPEDPIKICVFASGGGGNFNYLVKNQNEGLFCISALVVDKTCGAVSIAHENGIRVIEIERCDGLLDFDQLLHLEEIAVSEMIVLAGFMPILPRSFIKSYRKTILNTHPSLLPLHGGKGMYGVKVQESVINRGDRVAGCTCHIVDEGIDTGEIICQKKIVVDRRWTPWELGGKVFLLEGPNLIDAIVSIKTRMEKHEA